MCRVLLGLKHETKWVKEDKQTLQDGFDSLEIDWMRNNDPGSNAIVVRAADQILPYCVIRTDHTTPLGTSTVMPKKTPAKNPAPKTPNANVAKPVVATPPTKPNPSPPARIPKSKTKKKNDCVIN